jgi:cell wall-associated NlpC family hydrolase
LYSVIENTENWLKIKTAFDNYECWINVKQHKRITEALFNQISKQVPVYSCDLFHSINYKTKEINFPLPVGSRLPFFKEKKMSFDNLEYFIDGNILNGNEKKEAVDILKTAKTLINAPYLWGGKTPMGIDCSGFTQLVYKLNGYKLPRDAYQQVELGSPLSFVEEAEAGDLAFFDNEEGKIVHVGILIDNEHIIHASGNVRIDRFDHYGIHNTDTKKYSHTLRVVKRIL